MTDQPRWPAGTPVAPGGRGPGGGRFRGAATPEAALVELARANRYGSVWALLADYVDNMPAGRHLRPAVAEILGDASAVDLLDETPQAPLPPPAPPGGGGWAELASGRLLRGWVNNDASRAELSQIAAGQWSWPGEELGGNTSVTHRVDMPDGRSIVQKQFRGWFEEDFDGDELAEAEGILDQPYETQQDDIEKARAEVVASLVAEAIGALVPPVVQSPTDLGTVYMGFVDGEAGLWLPGHEDHYDEVDLSDLDSVSPAGQDAWRLGLLDLLIANNDRHAFNIITTPEGRLVGIDHGEADALIGNGLALPRTPGDLATNSPFAEMFWRSDIEVPVPGPHPFHPDDFVALTARLYDLRQRGALEEWEYRYMAQVLGFLSPHAVGRERLIP